jgi:hypothetical protein
MLVSFRRRTEHGGAAVARVDAVDAPQVFPAHIINYGLIKAAS